MNRQGKGKIETCDFTWNPISGCLNECDYCYLKRMKDFDMAPVFHPERLEEPVKRKKPAVIFTGSSGDMFGEWVETWQIDWVLNTIMSCPQHTFQVLTKNPGRYKTIANQDMLKNIWFGTTDDGRSETGNNVEALIDFVSAPRRFVSFEPLLKPIHINLEEIQWVIIGANTNKGESKPSPHWAEDLIQEARRVGAAVWMKSNYGYPEVIQEFPAGIRGAV